MVQIEISALYVLTALSFAAAAPIQKRIAQVIVESTADWEQACLAAGGAGQCNPISQRAFSSLLAAPGNCEQQDAADAMVDLAKELGNDAEMIRLAQLFVQQPRNAPDSLQVPYCQVAPKNSELDDLFHCQFEGSDFTQFSGDQTGNLPLGVAAVNPPGSCPALAQPVPDGVQLNTLVQDPFAAGTGGAAANAGAQVDAEVDNDAAADANVDAAVDNAADAAAPGTGNDDDAAAAAPPATGFALANGQEAIALNAEFDGLSANSPCTDGEQACVNGGFAQCVGGSFVITQCAGGLVCKALPLVNAPGTSITCTTEADADARIAATGAA